MGKVRYVFNKWQILYKKVREEFVKAKCLLYYLLSPDILIIYQYISTVKSNHTYFARATAPSQPSNNLYLRSSSILAAKVLPLQT